MSDIIAQLFAPIGAHQCDACGQFLIVGERLKHESSDARNAILDSGQLGVCRRCGHTAALDNGRVRRLTRVEADRMEKSDWFEEWRTATEAFATGRLIG